MNHDIINSHVITCLSSDQACIDAEPARLKRPMSQKLHLRAATIAKFSMDAPSDTETDKAAKNAKDIVKLNHIGPTMSVEAVAIIWI